jgi:hypothetical protein
MHVRYWVIGLGFLLLSHFTHASAEPIGRAFSPSSLSIDFRPSLFTYRETLTLSLKTMEDTWVPDIGVERTSYGFDAYYVRFHKRYSGDQIPDNSIGNGLRSKIPERVWAVESIYGYTWVSPTLLSLAVTTFGGIGYATGDRNLNLAENLIGEDYRWFYGTAGLRADWMLSPGLRVSPEIALKIPFAVASPLRTLDGDELKLPLSPAVDVTLPMTYGLTPKWQAYVIGMVERIYGTQGPAEILSSDGVPLGHISGFSTQQLSISFGFTHPF